MTEASQLSKTARVYPSICRVSLAGLLCLKRSCRCKRSCLTNCCPPAIGATTNRNLFAMALLHRQVAVSQWESLRLQKETATFSTLHEMCLQKEADTGFCAVKAWSASVRPARVYPSIRQASFAGLLSLKRACRRKRTHLANCDHSEIGTSTNKNLFLMAPLLCQVAMSWWKNLSLQKKTATFPQRTKCVSNKSWYRILCCQCMISQCFSNPSKLKSFPRCTSDAFAGHLLATCISFSQKATAEEDATFWFLPLQSQVAISLMTFVLINNGDCLETPTPKPHDLSPLPAVNLLGQQKH